MRLPRAGQTVHTMTASDVLRVLLAMRQREGRNVAELALYTTDDLRRLYQATNDDPIKLRDGIVSRVQLVAVIRWRVFLTRFSYGLLLAVSVASATFAFLAWRDPVSAPPLSPSVIGHK